MRNSRVKNVSSVQIIRFQYDRDLFLFHVIIAVRLKLKKNGRGRYALLQSLILRTVTFLRFTTQRQCETPIEAFYRYSPRRMESSIGVSLEQDCRHHQNFNPPVYYFLRSKSFRQVTQLQIRIPRPSLSGGSLQCGGGTAKF